MLSLKLSWLWPESATTSFLCTHTRYRSSEESSSPLRCPCYAKPPLSRNHSTQPSLPPPSTWDLSSFANDLPFAIKSLLWCHCFNLFLAFDSVALSVFSKHYFLMKLLKPPTLTRISSTRGSPFWRLFSTCTQLLNSSLLVLKLLSSPGLSWPSSRVISFSHII